MSSVALPRMKAIRQLSLRAGEVFMAAGGFEERALRFSRMLGPPLPDGDQAIVLRYSPADKRNQSRKIASLLKQKEYAVTQLAYNRHAPGRFDERLRRLLLELGAEGVCVDISGMSRLATMMVADVARELDLAVRLVYSEAVAYAPSRAEFEEASAKGQQHVPTSFIDTGLFDVVRVPRLASVRMQNRATLLIAFDSFNEALCQALVNVISPSRFILINGRPPRTALRWREHATARVHRRLREEWSAGDDNCPIKTTSTLRYEETYQLLVELYWRFSNTHRVILAPTGSKMQTVGCYLLRAVHDDVHVEYPTVEGFFARKYSTGVRETWGVDFGRLALRVDQLRRAETSSRLGLPEDPVDFGLD